MDEWLTTEDLRDILGANYDALKASIRRGKFSTARKVEGTDKEGKRVGRGGQIWQVHISDLAIPEKYRETWIFAQAPASPTAADNLPAVKPENLPAVIAKTELPEISELNKYQRETMDARMYFMRRIERSVAAGKGVNKSINDIADAAKDGTLPQEAVNQLTVANARKGESRTTSYDGMMKWWGPWIKSGKNPVVLAPRHHEILPQKVLTNWIRDYDSKTKTLCLAPGIPAWLPYFLDKYRNTQKPSMADAHRRMKKDLPAGVPVPSYSQITRLCEKIPEIYLEKGRMTGAEYKALLGYAERDSSEFFPMSVCQIDGHSFKAYVAHPTTGAHFHPEVCGVICLTTKMIVGHSAGLAESWRTVADAVRNACTVNDSKTRGGVMAILEPDKGAGNMAKVNSDADFGIFARVGITYLPPEHGGNPQGNGGIERSNQSLWIRAAKTLQTYTGKDMDRVTQKRTYVKLEKDLKAALKDGSLGATEKTSKLLLSWCAFLEFLAYWVNEYNNTPHRALDKITAPLPGEPNAKAIRRHMTPCEAWDRAVADGWSPTLYDGEMLKHLFMPHERITVMREKFTLYGNKYHAYELRQWHCREMIAAYDIHDADKVIVLDLEERPVCVATWDGNKRLSHPQSFMDKSIMDREERRSKNLEKKLAMVRSESGRKVIEVAVTRELPKDVSDFEQRQGEKQRVIEIAREGKCFYADCHELAEDIVHRQETDQQVGEYEECWIKDYLQSAQGSRRIGLYMTDPDCAGRFKKAE